RLSAHVESDWFFRFVRAGFIPPWKPESARQNDWIMDAVCDAVAAYAAAECVVFWDGIVGPWYLDPIQRRLDEHSIEPSYVVLRPDRETALDRVTTRDGSADLSGAKAMYERFVDLGGLEPHVVESTGPAQGVADAVRRGLEAGVFLLRHRDGPRERAL